MSKQYSKRQLAAIWRWYKNNPDAAAARDKRRLGKKPIKKLKKKLVEFGIIQTQTFVGRAIAKKEKRPNYKYKRI